MLGPKHRTRYYVNAGSANAVHPFVLGRVWSGKPVVGRHPEPVYSMVLANIIHRNYDEQHDVFVHGVLLRYVLFTRL